MNTQILKDSDFEKEYEKIILPFCEENKKSEYYETFDLKKMHYLSFINEKAKANVIILHGFTECAEKFDEMSYYFFGEGYNVFVPDLRGHGLSYKDEAPKYAVSSHGFDCYSKDIACFIKSVVCRNGLPVYCFSHSLGGNAALLTLIDNPELPVEKLILSSPMICGNMGMPTAVASLVAKLVCALGKGNMPAPGKCVFQPEKGNPDASSRARGEHALKLKAENEAYQTCGPTMEWVKHSVEARDRIVSAENIKKLKASMLVIKPETDRQLLESWQNKFISLCEENGKSIKVVQTKNTCHEIFQSESDELKKYFEIIAAFCDE
ncbi:MAG: alpha/beta fold hydrolase [Acutalibacteraceae bacterium]